jgi:hypothetical protein
MGVFQNSYAKCVKRCTNRASEYKNSVSFRGEAPEPHWGSALRPLEARAKCARYGAPNQLTFVKRLNTLVKMTTGMT